MLQKFRWPPRRQDPADPLRQHLLPHPCLRPFIAHYTLYYPPREVGEAVLHLVPDASGCIVLTDGEGGVRCHFLGASTGLITVANLATPPRLFVEFLPGGAHRLLDLPHRELADRRVDLDDACGWLKRRLLSCVAQAEDTRDLSGMLDGVFLALLERRPDPHPLMNLLFCLQRETAPTLQLLADRSGYSKRHVSRLAGEHLGVGLKSYLRMLRINRLLPHLQGGAQSLTALAHRFGYFDQAHFIHDFQAVCGASPGDYLSGMSAFYNEPFKF